MTLFQHTGGDPRVASAQLADVLAWYGAVGDAAFGNAPGFAIRKASVAVALASPSRESAIEERNATYFAGLLHAIGAIGNAAFRKDGDLDERTARTQRWDVPAHGARICASIASLPPATADLVRWQNECWDGTGYPDQLRWHGIPMQAQYLAIAEALLRADDAEEALSAIGMQSGRAYAPESSRAFGAWFRETGGEIALQPIPADALDSAASSASLLLDSIADRIDVHTAAPGRWRRVEALALATAHALNVDDAATRALALAARLAGSGEIGAPAPEQVRFDPLSRLGIEARAANAARATEHAAPIAAFSDALSLLQHRAEWFDGTGAPGKLRHQAIPLGAAILSASIAYDELDRGERLDTAAGTQFDPRVVRALLEAARMRA